MQILCIPQDNSIMEPCKTLAFQSSLAYEMPIHLNIAILVSISNELIFLIMMHWDSHSGCTNCLREWLILWIDVGFVPYALNKMYFVNNGTGLTLCDELLCVKLTWSIPGLFM